MPGTEDTERRRARTQAVDDEYKRLEKFHADSRRIVFIDGDNQSSGGYGIVQQAELHHSAYLPSWLASRQYGPPVLVAVKMIKVSAVGRMADLKRSFTKEMLVWSGLDAHPGIAKFLGFYADFKRSEAWLLSPWEPYGNINEFVRVRHLEVPEKLSLVYDTIDALSFLHQMNPPVCHGDIKSANVLVNSSFRALLCDFGLARLYEDNGFARLETSTGFKGSLRWCSPEILNGSPRNPLSDVYSWAWLVWEIMTGKLPYEGTSADYAIMRQIFESPLPQVDGESRLSDCLQVWELMTRCWVADPLQRPTASMCRTTVTYLPRCVPTPDGASHQTRSAELLENLGDLESWKGNYTESVAHLDKALRLYEEELNAKGIASVLRKQAVAAYRYTDSTKALAIASAALKQCRDLNDAPGIADASFWLGCSLMMLYKEDEALPILREGLELYRMQGNDVGTAQCLERIGEIQRRNGQRAEASSSLQESIAIASRSGDRLGVAKALDILGTLRFDESATAEATATLSEACSIARKIGWDHGVSSTLWTMGAIKVQLEDFEEAEKLFQEAISIARRSNSRWRLAQVSDALGRCLQRQGRFEEAVPVLEEVYLLYQEMSLIDGAARVATVVAELKDSRGEYFSGAAWYDRAIASYRSMNDRREIMFCLERKRGILVKIGRYDEAALHLEAAMVVAKEIGSFYEPWLRRKLSDVPKTAMKWESRLPLLCDIRRLQRRVPQLATASLKLQIPFSYGEP